MLAFCCSAPAISAAATPDKTTSELLRDEPSADTSPVSFSIYGVTYSVPRNYITKMENWSGGPQDMVNFRATFPGMQPLTEKTARCLTQPRAYWPPGCIPIEFWIHGGRGALSDDDHFNNMRDLFHGQIPEKGPAGFEIYRFGPEDAPTEVYRKRTPEHTILVTCLYDALDGHRKAVCENYASPLPNGDSLFYLIDLEQIPNAEKIDSAVRSLIASFTLKGLKDDPIHAKHNNAKSD